MAKVQEKQQALLLRRAGKSVREIAKELGVSRGSVSAWVRDITLSAAQKEQLRTRAIARGHKGRLLGAEMNRQKKIAAIEKAKSDAYKTITEIAQSDLFMLGLGLYWGEGAKSSNGHLSISNSDPRIIRIAMDWFTNCFGVERERFRPRIFISDVHRDRTGKILRFWSQELGIPITQFAKVIFLKRGKKIYENHETYYGVVALHVLRGSEVRYKVLALIERVAELLPT